MMEPVVLPEMKSDEEVAAIKASKRGWACVGRELDYAHRSWIEPGHWRTEDMQRANEDAAASTAPAEDAQAEEYRLDDAEVVSPATASPGGSAGPRWTCSAPRASRPA